MASHNDTPDMMPQPGDPGHNTRVKADLSQIEKVMSDDELHKGSQADYDRMDKEVAAYTTGERVYVSEEDNKRLKTMIDRRVLCRSTSSPLGWYCPRC